MSAAAIPIPTAVLVAYAHPDDESFGPAALLAKYARRGSAIYGLFGTRGEGGQSNMDPPPPAEELARLRGVDLAAATAAIGFREIEGLGYPDGGLPDVPAEQLEGQVLAAIRRHRPQVVLTFGPAGITRHPDHLAIHRATVSAFHRALAEGLGVRELYYDAVPAEVATEMGLVGELEGAPNTFIDVAETAEVKLDALRAHARHIKDAEEMVARLEAEPQTTSPLYRAYPEVPRGQRVSGFLQDPQPPSQSG